MQLKRPSKKGQIPTHFLGKLKRSKTKIFALSPPRAPAPVRLATCSRLRLFWRFFCRFFGVSRVGVCVSSSVCFSLVFWAFLWAFLAVVLSVRVAVGMLSIKKGAPLSRGAPFPSYLVRVWSWFIGIFNACASRRASARSSPLSVATYAERATAGAFASMRKNSRRVSFFISSPSVNLCTHKARAGCVSVRGYARALFGRREEARQRRQGLRVGC